MDSYKLHKIDIKDYKTLKKYFALRPARTCESIVNSSFIWRDYYNARYYINKYGIVFLYDVGEGIFTSSPLCKKEDIRDCVEDMRLYFNNVLNKRLIMCVTDYDTVQAVEDMTDVYDIQEDRRYFDYVYAADKLRSLSGKAYHKKKNHLNSFLKSYEGRYETRILSGEDKDIIFEFLDRWHSAREIEDDYNRDDFEITGIKRFLSEMDMIDDDMNMKMFGVFVDGVLEAFTLGTYLHDLRMVFVHVEKANPLIRGLYTFINQQFQIICFQDAELVNREDDMGIEGLRQAKMSYNPIYMEKKYTITQKNKNVI